jgi:predicted nucleotidyltransferase
MENLNEKLGLNLKYLCTFYGGSHLYGLNTPNSDLDHRGVFINTTPNLILGLDRFDSTDKVSDDVDFEFYEIRHFMRLLLRGNTQGFECLFAPSETFSYMDTQFDSLVRQNAYSLVDSVQLKKCLDGYIIHEKKLASGERRGKEGGKRHDTITQWGFSPKNYVQIFRLIFAGTEFFSKSKFPVNLRSYDPVFADRLLDIKTHPEKYSKEDLMEEVEQAEQDLTKAFDQREKNYKFDKDLANAILEDFYTKQMGWQLPEGMLSAVEYYKQVQAKN